MSLLNRAGNSDNDGGNRKIEIINSDKMFVVRTDRDVNKYKALLVQRVHILSWIKTYDRNIAISDLIAGITLGLTIIPQSIAYAALAGLPSQYGLYSSFIGSLIYVIFGSIKEVSIGPTGLQSLLTFQYTMNKPVEFIFVLTFLSGCVEFIMGLAKLGFIVDFISIPVTSAFTSATSLIIVGSQLGGLIGVKNSSNSFVGAAIQFFTNLKETKLPDMFLSVGCIVFLLVMRQIKEINISRNRRHGPLIKKVLWYLSLSRNAIAITITSFIAFLFIESSSTSTSPFKLSGNVTKGLPDFRIPSFTINVNETLSYSFADICRELGSGILVVPLVAILANISIAKAFSSGKPIDATQEMLSLGLCNVIGSGFGSLPTCGAFTRSAVSHASGVQTPMAGLYSGIMTLLALSLLTPYFYYIPKSTLSAVLICAVIFMIDYKICTELWKKNRRDFITWGLSFLACIIFGVEIGLIVGVLINIGYLLFLWARPSTSIVTRNFNGNKFIEITPNVGMFYPGVENLREKANNLAYSTKFQLPIVINCTKMIGLDYTSAKVFELLAKDLAKQNQFLFVTNFQDSWKQLMDEKTTLRYCDSDYDLAQAIEHSSRDVEKDPLVMQDDNNRELKPMVSSVK